jgi:hypothetical protein
MGNKGPQDRAADLDGEDACAFYSAEIWDDFCDGVEAFAYTTTARSNWPTIGSKSAFNIPSNEHGEAQLKSSDAAGNMFFSLKGSAGPVR